jgi:hypothetical protein
MRRTPPHLFPGRIELAKLWETLPLSERQETLQTLNRLLAQQIQSLDKKAEVRHDHLA